MRGLEVKPGSVLRVRPGSAVLAAAVFLALVPACTATRANGANASDSRTTSQPASTAPSSLPPPPSAKSPKPLPARFKGTKNEVGGYIDSLGVHAFGC